MGFYLRVVPSSQQNGDRGSKTIENTGRINLPDQVLEEVLRSPAYNRMQVMSPNRQVPMQFQLRSSNGQKLCAGVHEFSSSPGTVMLPRWMMEHLKVRPNDTVSVDLVNLPDATRAVFQPQSSSFESIINPKVVLEHALRDYPCLTQGSNIPIVFNNKEYIIKVLKTDPDAFVSTFNVDMITEFAPAVDQFTHNWDQSDTDSSEDETIAHIEKLTGRTLSGETVTIGNKPLHSTFEQRELDRLNNIVHVGIRRYEDGKEILPPKPKEKKKLPKVDPFKGQSHSLKVPKNKNTAPSDDKQKQNKPSNIIQPQEEQEKPVSNPFIGKPKTLGGSRQ